MQEESTREMAICLPVFDSEAINVLIALPAVDVEPCPKTFKEAAGLETATRGQVNNQLWHQHKMFRFTASHFGNICKRKKTVDRVFF